MIVPITTGTRGYISNLASITIASDGLLTTGAVVITDTRGAMNTLIFNEQMKKLRDEDMVVVAAREFIKRLVV